MFIRRFAAIAAVSLFAGCAIHPVPEDVTGLDTADIVKQIRCETRDAARKVIIRYLTQLATYGNDPIAQGLLVKFEADPESMTTFDAHRSFSGAEYLQVRNVFEVIYSAGVAYTFDLTMSEDNNLSASANFLGAWAAKFTLGLMGDANRTRENERTFTITDRFGFLLRELNTPKPVGGGGYVRYCDKHITLGPNYIYPITGRIGVYNTTYTFFQLSFFDGLAANKPDPFGAGSPTLADKLTFTTIVDLTVSPKVVFAPASTGFQITDASLGAFAKRRDVHQVTVGLALDPKGKGLAALSSLRGFVFSGAGLGRGAPVKIGNVLVLNRVTATTTSPAEQLAVLAIDQLKSRELQLITSASP